MKGRSAIILAIIIIALVANDERHFSFAKLIIADKGVTRLDDQRRAYYNNDNATSPIRRLRTTTRQRQAIDDVDLDKSSSFISTSNGPSSKATWMGEILSSDMVPNARLDEFLLPGSHDSASLDFYNDVCPGQADTIPSGVLPEGARRATSQTQELDLYAQLETAGMRLLDIRFDDDTYNGQKFPLHHSFYVRGNVDTLYKALVEVVAFLQEYPTEIVIVVARTNACGALSSSSRIEIQQMINNLPEFDRLREFQSSDLGRMAVDLQGMGLVDIEQALVKERYCGGDCGIVPEEWAEYNQDNFGGSSSGTLNLRGFFPAPGLELAKAVVNPKHDGIAVWDADFEQNMWMIHSVLGQNQDLFVNEPNRIHSLFGNRVGGGGLFDVAWQLSLSRMYAARVQDGLITRLDFVHDVGERFEFHCPPGFLLQGITSIREVDGKEQYYYYDRQWKGACGQGSPPQSLLLDGEPQYYSQDLDSFVQCDNVYDCHHPLAFSYKDIKPDEDDERLPLLLQQQEEVNLMNEWHGPVDFVFENGEFALTGMGSIYNHYFHDRRFWFYIAETTTTATASDEEAAVNAAECDWREFPDDLVLTADEWISGVRSEYDKVKRDRQWRFYVCTTSTP